MSASSQRDANEAPAAKSLLSAERLRQAFSRMLGQRAEPSPRAENDQAPPLAIGGAAESSDMPSQDDHCEINPRSIVEAMLFVGRPDGRPLSAREMASGMRDVSPREVEAAVGALNELYLRDGAPYTIVGESGGFRLVLREEFQRVREKFHGRVREAKLTPAVLEVLSLVAYHQPITLEEIDKLRGASSGSLLRSLVQRELVRLERSVERPRQPKHYTTGRFLRFFGLNDLDELPRRAEMEAA